MARLLMLVAALLAGCAFAGGNGAEVDALRSFDRHQLLWLGERFERWELEHVDLVNLPYVLLIYGECDVEDPDGILGPEGGSCAPPLQLELQPLCRHIDVVARSPLWKRRQVRSAPVGSIDGAPVLFTSTVQVKVYRGQGTEPGVELRALGALRSANRIAPLIGPGERIPPAPRRILERRFCD